MCMGHHQVKITVFSSDIDRCNELYTHMSFLKSFMCPETEILGFYTLVDRSEYFTITLVIIRRCSYGMNSGRT